MNEVIAFSELVVRIGSLFSKCDGVYDSREDEFIKSFTKKLIENQIINGEIEMHLEKIAHEDCSFEEIVSSTNNYLAQFNDTEKRKIKGILKEFIEELIAADSVYAPEEIDLYNRWVKEFHSEEK